MLYTVRITDGHCYQDVEIATDKGIDDACEQAMTMLEAPDYAYAWEHFESDGKPDYVDSVSNGEDYPLDVPVAYRQRTERVLLTEIEFLKAENERLKEKLFKALVR
jgi:hypothetical protein